MHRSGPRPARTVTLPPVRLFRPRGLACVYVAGRRLYLGPWGSPEAHARYHALCQELIDDAKRAGKPAPPAQPDSGPRPQTVAELGDRYRVYAEGYYRKRNEPTKHALSAARAIALLAEAGLDGTPLRDAGPKWLKRYQAHLVRDGRFGQKTINEYVRLIVRMIQWAVTEEWLPAEAHAALDLVDPIRRGRSPVPGVAAPRPARTVRPVPRAHVQRVRRLLPRPVRQMVLLQELTGARPGELCHMRASDVYRTTDARVWVYLVDDEVNKTAHHGDGERGRRVYLGPRAQRVLRPLIDALRATPGEYIFSPRRFVAEHFAARSAARRTPRWPSHDPASRRARRLAEEGATADYRGARYTTDSYAGAIERACRRAGVPVWTPHRLRHNAASALAGRESLEIARELLGHRSIATTMRYVEVSDRRAIAAAARRA